MFAAGAAATAMSANETDDSGLRQRKGAAAAKDTPAVPADPVDADRNPPPSATAASDSDSGASESDASDDSLIAADFDAAADEQDKATGRARIAEVKAQRQEELRQLAREQGGGSGGSAPSFRQRLGATVQRSEVQVIVLILIVLDIASALVQMFSAAGVIPGHKTAAMVRVAKFLEYQSAVTIMVFILEMAVALIAFGFMILSHPGYTVDLAIVIAQVYLAAVYDSVAIRLLGVVRLWRLLRLVDNILEEERDAHAYSLEALEEERSRVDDLLAQLREKDHTLKRERERLSRANEMLRNYKDDNAWLVDALHIAAESAAGGAGAAGMPPGMVAGGTGGVLQPTTSAVMNAAAGAVAGAAGSGMMGPAAKKKKDRKRAKIKIGAEDRAGVAPQAPKEQRWGCWQLAESGKSFLYGYCT